MSGGSWIRILHNALTGAGARIAMMAIGFSLTPFIVHSLGLQNFGLFSIVGALAGYLGLLDFGLGGAFVKFITQYVEQGDKAAARQVVSFGMIFYTCFGAALALPVFLLAPAIVHLFKMPPQDVPGAIGLFRILFVVLAASMVLGLPGTVVVSMHRMDLASRNNVIGYLAYAAATVVLLRRGWGIDGIVAAQGLQVVTTAALQYVTARALFGGVWHNPGRFDALIIRRLFGFGAWTQLNSMFSMASLDIGRFITAGTVSVASVSYYEIGSKLAWFTKSLPAYLSDAILPAASAADAHRDGAWLDRMYRCGTFYLILGALGFAGFIVGANDAIMRVWMGETLPYVASVTLCLTVGYAVSSLTGVGVTILRAGGVPRYETFYTGIATVANLSSTIVLVPRFGVVGVALGTAIGWLAGTLYFLTIYHRLRRSSWWRTIGSPAVRLGCACILSALATSFAIHTEFIWRLFADRYSGLGALTVLGTAYLGLYLSLSRLSGAWRPDTALLPGEIARIAA